MAEKFRKKLVLRKLPCVLTQEELQQRGQSLASCRLEIDRLTAEMKAQAAEYKDQLKGLGQESRRLAKVVKDRQETREVRCEAVLDFVEGRFYVVRTDMGEVLESRPMTDAERQMSLTPAPDPGGSMEVEFVLTPQASGPEPLPPGTPPPPPLPASGRKAKKGDR